MIVIGQKGSLLTLAVRVMPRASRTTARGVSDGALKVAVAAPPVDGAANEELIRFLARMLGVAGRQISIIHGQHGRQKTIGIEGLSREEISGRIEMSLAARPD